MAKKVVATLKKEGGKTWAKVVRAVKNDNGGYSFREDMVPSDEVRLFAGYSGWSAGQLLGEMHRKSWIRHPASAGKVFTLSSDAFWREILREKGGRFKLLANYPVDPRLN